MSHLKAPETAFICRICGSGLTRGLLAREMMYGLRENCEYYECDDCGCVQIASYPEDMSRHYPMDYYAHSPKTASDDHPFSHPLRAVAKSVLMKFPAYRKRWLADKPRVALYAAYLDDFDAKILDVGCGAGALLRQLRALGFRRAEGVDPFIPADVPYEGTVLVRRAGLSDLMEDYDCISFHHSLEHMPDQRSVFADVARLLNPHGIAIIRIPIVGGAAWQAYRERWVQLDPPRHFYLHSERSLRMIAEQCGLSVTSITHDSSGFQLWGSELYVRDIPLRDPRSPSRGSNEIFSRAELAEYDRRAAVLNAANEGDQIVAILQPQP